MSVELPKLSSPMSINASFADGIVHVRLAGTADVEAKPDLDAVTKKLHEECLRLTATKVVVDLRELEFMNSSCFKAFVAWIAMIRDLETDKQYRMHLLSNPNL
ncbi:MAG: uncharacterized protein JWO36_3053, partial [Myxococcales bacterium]|nr:uncharacterized protein [Myxococcales bacterium]